MTTQNAQQILSTLAKETPEYEAMTIELEALLPSDPPIPEEFAGDVLEILRAEPEEAAKIDTYEQDLQNAQAFGMGTILGASAVIVCALVVLRSHVKIERDKDGKITFKYEHKPADNELLEKVISAIAKVLGTEKN